MHVQLTISIVKYIFLVLVKMIKFYFIPNKTKTRVNLLNEDFMILSQIIGRVNADPDYLPRAIDFGLNVNGFLEHYYPPDCPRSFFPLAVLCCDLDHEKRCIYSASLFF